MIEVDRMPEPDVSPDGDAHAASGDLPGADDDQHHHRGEDGDMMSLRKTLEEERERAKRYDEALKSVINCLAEKSEGADLDKKVSDIVEEHEKMRTTRIS